MPISVEEISDNLEYQKCVLFLGPDVAKNLEGKLMQTGLRDHIVAANFPIEYDADNFFICDEQTKNRIYTPLRQYYERHNKPNEIHSQISQIPFHLIISITPDLLLKQAFEQNDIAYEFSYYAKGEATREVEEPTKDKPLIYNLFGCIEKQESLILSHDDILGFLFSIIKEYELPKNLRLAIGNVTHYVFFGFNFERWYLKLLLRIFDLTKGKTSISAERNGCTSVEYRDFFHNIYHMEFIDTNIDEYAKNLYQICQGRKILREPKITTPKVVKKELRDLIKCDKIDEAIDKLENIFQYSNQELYKDVLNISGSYSRLRNQIRRQEINDQDSKVQMSNICRSLLDYVEEVET